MEIGIVAVGSRGDVQPYIALGVRLRAAGYGVRIAAAEDYRPLVEGYGLRFAPLVGEIRALMDPELVYATLDAAGESWKLARRFQRAVAPVVRQVVLDVWEASQGVDALIASTLGFLAAESAAALLGIPCLRTSFHPDAPTGAFPDMRFPVLPAWVPRPQLYNRLTHLLGRHAFWQLLRQPINEAREILGLPRRSPLSLFRRVEALDGPMLYGYSHLVAPRPPDWDANQHVTGYWFLDHPPDWTPPAALEAFIESGSPPVYIGFGSALIGRDPDRVTAILVEALGEAGQRGILYAGWGDMGNIPLPPHIIRVADVPHTWLFPRMAAAVHHGGAGTTAAALQAGIPSVVIPALGDMMFWGQRVHALGVGSAPLLRPDLTVPRLAARIRQAVGEPGMRMRAAALGKALVAEDGVGQAAALLQQWLGGGARRA